MVSKLNKEYDSDIIRNVEYRVNGKLHREDGPARIYTNGDVEYWVNGRLHNENGPAVIYNNGGDIEYLEYWINGKRIK